ncbi:uncharacterized protein TNCV_4187001 [Trichonephila clavipes]|nr:uncharacterized protein TNCV_4187001 [Trichonephila clavipes]
MDQRAPNNSNWQQMTEGDVSVQPYSFLEAVGSTLVYCYRCTNVGFVNICCTVDCMQGCLYTGFPSWQTIDGYVYNGVISTEPGKLIGTKLSFQMNHASICGAMMAAFMLDAMPVNTA